MKKVGTRCALFLFLLLCLSLVVSAESEQTAKEEYRDFLQAIPPEVQELLPESFLQSPLDEAEGAVSEAGGVNRVFSMLATLTGLSIKGALSLLAQICGLLLLGAVLRALGEREPGGTGDAFRFCSALVLTVSVFVLQRDVFGRMRTYFDTVRGLCLGFLPLMGTLYAMGGNLKAAVANHGVLSGFLVLLETFCAGSVLPIAGVCLAFALMDALCGGVNLRPLASLVKRTYTLTLSFLMLLLCGVLGLQSTLTKAGDTLALRTAGFAAGSFLPVVGGSISQTLRTVAASVEYLRAVAGSGAILVLFFAFLPTFLSIVLYRTAFLLGGAVAKLLGGDGEEKILSEFGSVYGYFLSVMACIFVMLVFSLTLFARTAAAG